MRREQLPSNIIHARIERILSRLKESPKANIAGLCRDAQLSRKTFYWAMQRDEYQSTYRELRSKRGENVQKGRIK